MLGCCCRREHGNGKTSCGSIIITLLSLGLFVTGMACFVLVLIFKGSDLYDMLAVNGTSQSANKNNSTVSDPMTNSSAIANEID